ncbi:MAG: FtsW/RodA/SpoVE family cell cycle protein [Planctomycetes bacterium]|nr:FtsW/RodA/SpoVE family cell cycle protein [Planctomycetota bacterium]
MSLIQRVRLRDLSWGVLLVALLLTAFGVACVISAKWDPGNRWGFGHEAQMQLAWWLVSLIACICITHITATAWREAAMFCYTASLLTQFAMIALAGSALVPKIKGQANWLVLGGLRVQPSEFVKLAVLLFCARVATYPGFDVRRFSHVLGVLAVAAVPAALMAKEDLGSALTFPPMAIGILFVAGMRLRHLAVLALAALVLIAGGIAALPKSGEKAYQWKRIQAWWSPEDFASTEAYQTEQSTRSIGSGQLFGKGYASGDLNRLGWLPEKHTDLIFAIAGEEWGFVGSLVVVGGFLLFGWCGLYAATQARDPFARLLGAGYVCLIIGQASINLAVAVGLMPVTGITLPFFSYGGSSLLACYLGLGLLLSASLAPRSGGTSLNYQAKRVAR